jgi:hypothetical protein
MASLDDSWPFLSSSYIARMYSEISLVGGMGGRYTLCVRRYRVATGQIALAYSASCSVYWLAFMPDAAKNCWTLRLSQDARGQIGCRGTPRCCAGATAFRILDRYVVVKVVSKYTCHSTH